MTEEKESNNIIFLIMIPVVLVPLLLYGISRTWNTEKPAAEGPVPQQQSAQPPAPAAYAGEEAPDEPLPGDYETASQEPLISWGPVRKAEDPSLAAARRREMAFLREHGREIKDYQNYLGRLGRKYMAKYPALRQVDSDFAKMDRYMALNKQYAADRDAYKWVRGVMALPEVRNKIISYSGNPEVLRAMVELSLEALKNPPSDPVNDEVRRVLASDDKVAPYVGNISMGAMGNMTTTLPFAVAQGTDLSPLMKLGGEIVPGGKPAARR